MMSLGFQGRLLSSSFVETKITRKDPTPFADARRRAIPALGPASSLRAVLEIGARPLLQAAGIEEPRDLEISTDLIVATVTTGAAPVALLIAPWGHPLGGYWRRAVEHATRRRARWCLLYNGVGLRVMDAARPYSSRFVEFDIDCVADDEMAAAAFQLVATALDGSLEVLVRDSDRHGVGVCRSLKDGVLTASSSVLSSLLRPRRSRRPADLDAALEQALTIVYRVVFLLFAESRGLVPLWHPTYRRSYAIDTLVTLASRGESTGLWDALRAIARLAHAGCRAGDLRVTPFNGRLFAPARTPLADRRDLDDEQACRALVALATRAGSNGGGRERIAYRDLGVEQLGSVYESLLDYRPSTGPTVLVPGAGVRKATGTFYTPQSITDYLVRATLGPLVDGARPHEILALRIVDPAMGSGAFLVAACQYLARAYESALVREEAGRAAGLGDAERTLIRRAIAERCLYGVDINPMAVQLARLSVWLTTLAADRPLTFLDHRLQCGDSLLGAWLENLRAAPARHPRVQPDTRSGRLFADGSLESVMRDVLPIRFSLERTSDDTLDRVRAKEHALATLQSPAAALAQWKRIADAWCASWLSPDAAGIPAAAFHALSDYVLGGRSALPPPLAGRLLERAERLAAASRLFHWELEFPEVFFDEHGRRRPRPGFDAVLGNPPWEMIRADTGPSDTRRRRRADNGARLRFFRRSGLYPSSSTGHANLYQLFADRSVALLRPGGRLGLVLPSGLAIDHGSAALRRRLLGECDLDALVSIDNHRGVFAVHRGLKFLLLTGTKGAPTQSIACRLGEPDVATLDGADPRSTRADGFHVRMTPALIERLSGSAMTIPDVRSPLDLAVAERAATLFPPMRSAAGWSASFGRELNATDDRPHFGGAGLPVVEGKHITPFRVHLDRCDRRIAPALASRLLPKATFGRARLAYRDVASATNRTTLVAAILPAGCVSTHTLFCLRTPATHARQHFLCGLFNSLAVNYLIRMRVTTHVTTATVEQLPIPPPGYAPSVQQEIAVLARLLSRRDDRGAWIRLQVLAAQLYQLTRPEVAHVLSTFPLVAEQDRDAVREAYAAASTLSSW